MAKRILSFLLVATLAVCGIGASHTTDSCTFKMISDLHFTLQSNSTIYPFMNRIWDLTDTVADEVIDCHPDAFFLCGDNTNSGREEDVNALSSILRRIHAAGIPVVVIPGNHDFDLGDRDSFALAYGDLCSTESQDQASLSYMLHIGPFRILAMDDSSYSKGAKGAFSEETMGWLQSQLEEAQSLHEPVLFLSHHNVLPGGRESEGSSYMIQNPELRDLLEDYGVRLCLSGHRHSQEVLSHGEMYEIISAAPAASPHLLGVLTLEGGTMRYEARPIDFSAFGAGYGLGDLPESERFQEEHYRAMLCESSSFPHYDEATQNRVLALFQRFLTCYGNGALLEVREEILSDPAYEAFRDVFSTTNYGLWMEALLHSDALPGNHLELSISHG